MIIGLAVGTGNAVVERPAADAHDAWSAPVVAQQPAADAQNTWSRCRHWHCRGKVLVPGRVTCG